MIMDHARGLATSCDAYVYSFSYDVLVSRINSLIDAYKYARHLLSQGASFDEATRNDELETIKWTHTLKQSLKNNEEIEFDESCVREALYRPFTKIWLYEDHRILSQARATADLFRGNEIAGGGGVCITSPSNRSVFGTVATSLLPDLCAVGTNQPARVIPRRRSC